jgi:hypothetical protein
VTRDMPVRISLQCEPLDLALQVRVRNV